jgi:DNA-binding FadR family transcriptional regulator
VNGVGRRQDGSDGIQAERLSDLLYERLTSMLSAGEFVTGGRLPSESRLAERFSVSRPMVREALSRLRQDGIITSRKGAGSFVCDREAGCDANVLGFAPMSSLAQVKKAYEFRIGVEGEAAFWAAQNRSCETLAQLRGALEKLDDAIERRAIGVEPDYEFHLAIARASGNAFFETVMIAMRAPMIFSINLSRSLSLTRPLERLRVVQAEHVAIYEAIEDSDRQAACSAVRRHISATCDRVFEGSVGEYGGPLPP